MKIQTNPVSPRLSETQARCYRGLIEFPDFASRYQYLKLDGIVGGETFGFERYLNQKFYHSLEWRSIRDYIIIRDGGCDLGVGGIEIRGQIYIHHMNPITAKDIRECTDILLNPEFLISVSQATHNAIHYGDQSLLNAQTMERALYDTCPWKKQETHIRDCLR